MANSELSKPIKRKWQLPAFLDGVPRIVAVSLLGVCVLLLASATVWIFITDDPLGGEPVTVVALRSQVDSFADRDLDFGDLRAADDSDVAMARRTEDGGWSYEQGSNVIVGGPRIAGDGDAVGSLSTRPDPRLIEDSLFGPLPKIGDDGSRPLDVYSAPVRVSAVQSPKIALVIGGMGLSQTRSLQAIETLPSEVTFAFSPYGASLERWTMAARQAGHELLVQVPLEPFDYPDNDPGPHTLLLGASERENTNRLYWILSRITNYVGIINEGGARYLSTPEAVGSLANELMSRGLMLVDNGVSAQTTVRDEAQRLSLPSLSADAVIDAIPTPQDIQSKLLQLEQLARSRGHAIGVAAALPVTIEEVAKWAEELEARGVHIVPVTAIEAQLSGRLDG